MHDLGYAHSIEVWEDKKLKGGLYGLAIGKVFFAESMFSKSTNGSKLALIALMGVLALNQFLLLDVLRDSFVLAARIDAIISSD